MVMPLFFTSLCYGQAAVWGRVQDDIRQELAGATVTAQSLSFPLLRFSTKTDGAGNYVFQELPDGDFSLGAIADGHIGTTYSPIKIRYPARESRDFILPLVIYETKAMELNASVTGTLLVGGKPLSRATVCLLREPVKRCVETNHFGQYSLMVEPGVYRAWVMNNERILWASSLEFPRPDSYRDPIRIKP
jgi:hypothetical protein